MRAMASLAIAIVLATATAATAAPAACNLMPPGYAWNPDTAGLRTPDQLAALFALVDAQPATGLMGMLNVSQSNGRETFTNVVRKLRDGTSTTPSIDPRWVSVNAGRSLTGITDWATTHETVNGQVRVADRWLKVYSLLSQAGLIPRSRTPFVTPSPRLGIVRFWAVGEPLAAAPANLPVWEAETRSKIEKVIRILHQLAPNAIIELTGQDTPQYSTSKSPLARPWNVAAEDRLLARIASDGVPLSAAANQTDAFVPLLDSHGGQVRFRALTYMSRLTDGATPRVSIASPSFPIGKFYPCSWYATDRIHLIDGVPGTGYDASAQSDVERWYADPVFYRLGWKD